MAESERERKLREAMKAEAMRIAARQTQDALKKILARTKKKGK